MAILGLVSSVASNFVKVRYVSQKAVIDNLVFRLHYRVTSVILFVCCILVTANNLIGEPIQCINNNKKLDNVINTFCWITSTFTIPFGSMEKIINSPPGLGPMGINKEKTVHAYYQWVPFMLFLQGILFYAPHWFWKNWEQGKVRMISDGIRGTAGTISNDKEQRLTRLSKYLYDSRYTHNFYCFGYFFSEVLNFANVVGNIFFIDKFLGGAFLTYGPKVLSFIQMDQQDRYDPVIEVFPRLTKCTFRKFGPSGTPEEYDSLCVLALNILNEKIFIFLWFWFVILSIISGLALIYSAAVILSPRAREAILKRRFRFGTPQGVECLVRRTQVGDFLLLHLLGQNMSMRVFGEVLDDLSRRLQMNSNPHYAAPIYPNIDEYTKDLQYTKEVEKK